MDKHLSDALKREQVSAQCSCIARMAEAIAEVHRDYASLFHCAASNAIVDQVGKRTAELMELLGDVLNEMDVVGEEDEWMTPVFEKAQEMFPINEQISSPDEITVKRSLLEWAQQNIDCVEDEGERQRVSAAISAAIQSAKGGQDK